MITIETVIVTPFMQNARVVGCSETKEAVIVDPGGNADRIMEALKAMQCTCRAIWLTHSHLDHCGAVAPLLEQLGVPLFAHFEEQMMRSNVRQVAAMYGLPTEDFYDCPEPDTALSGGEVLKVGNLSAEVLFTPGHSPGHVSFFFPEQGLVLSGDVLFKGGIGRTDLPGGQYPTLMRSIDRLMTLPDDTRVLSGHGDDTTIGDERQTNPFLVPGSR